MHLRAVILALVSCSPLLAQSIDTPDHERLFGKWRSNRSGELDLLLQLDGRHFTLAAASRAGEAYADTAIIPIKGWGSDREGTFVTIDAQESANIQIPDRVYYTLKGGSLRVDFGSLGRLKGIHTLHPDGQYFQNLTLVILAALGLGALVVAFYFGFCRSQGEGDE